MQRILYFILPLFIGGCSNFTYYVDTINGHHELLEKSRPIDSVISGDISEDLKKKLVTFQKARLFAIQELLLPDNNSYKSYADIGRPYATWNVIATPEYSIEPKKWCFLIVGCLNYRGYFSKQQAEAFAKQLKTEGYDTYVAGARAYSTLGWFDDPLLNTMMFKSEASRVGILFHELAHQKMYVEDDSSFNEAFATVIEQEGTRRWFKATGKDDELKEYILSIKRNNEFNLLLRKTRDSLIALYNSTVPDEIKRAKKADIFSQLKQDYQKLKKQWQGYNTYDKWMSQDLNNAHLAIAATYNEFVPVFKKLLIENKNDLKEFYNRVSDLSAMSKNERSNRIKSY